MTAIDPLVATGPAAFPTERSDVALQVDVATDLDAVENLATEWASLHQRSGTTNPFTHPMWVLPWARRFLRRSDPHVVNVRRDGELIGIAPLCWVRGARFAAGLHLMGNSVCAELTEMPGVLAAQNDHRTVMRQIVGHLQGEASGRWDWVKLTLDARQGWFEPQWLSKTSAWQSPFYVHQSTRAFVMVDLPGDWETFLRSRKRNVRESIRRSTNRLSKALPDWSVQVVTDPEAAKDAAAQVMALHERRSHMAGKPRHPSMFTQDGSAKFFIDAVAAMAGAEAAEVSLLRAGGRTLGGLVSLRAGDEVFCSITGADPTAWSFGPGTLLFAELFRREIGRGTRAVNLSGGPNQSKLRWNERLEYNHDFAVVGARRRSKPVFALYQLASTGSALHRAMAWDTREPARP